MFKKTISICLVLILALCLNACGGGPAPVTTEPSETTPETITEPVDVSTDPQEEVRLTYFEEYGLEEKLLDKSGEYELTLPCGMDATKDTVAKVTVEGYKTIPSDEDHPALDGYEWKIMSLKLHFYDENAQAYGLNMGRYLWDDRYTGGQAQDEEDIIEELFTTGMEYPIVCNGVEYSGGLLHIGESVTGWLEDETGAYYLDIFVTVSVRVPVGYDGFVFGLESTNWEWPAGAYLHEVITDDTLLFHFD